MDYKMFYEVEQKRADKAEDALAAAIARAEAAEKRVAELEAAQEWRPVTEKPEKLDWRSGFIVATESEMVYYADEYNKGAWLWGDGWMKEIEGVTHWRPLPPPPQGE